MFMCVCSMFRPSERKRAGEGLREERMEQGSKEMKRQGRYPEYTVYSHPIPQRALLQMKNSEHVYIINSVYCLSDG